MEYRVTEEAVEAFIEKEEYIKLGRKMTACHMTLKDGHEVVGIAGVVDPDMFDMEIGKKHARVKAKDAVWQHMGSVMQYKRYLAFK